VCHGVCVCVRARSHAGVPWVGSGWVEAYARLPACAHRCSLACLIHACSPEHTGLTVLTCSRMHVRANAHMYIHTHTPTCAQDIETHACVRPRCPRKHIAHRYYNIMYDLAAAGNPWAQKEYAAMLKRLNRLRKVRVGTALPLRCASMVSLLMHCGKDLRSEEDHPNFCSVQRPPRGCQPQSFKAACRQTHGGTQSCGVRLVPCPAPNCRSSFGVAPNAFVSMPPAYLPVQCPQTRARRARAVRADIQEGVSLRRCGACGGRRL